MPDGLARRAALPVMDGVDSTGFLIEIARRRRYGMVEFRATGYRRASMGLTTCVES